MHWFSTTFSPILDIQPIEGPPLPQREQQTQVENHITSSGTRTTYSQLRCLP
jgi:hypothetical protein